MIHNAAYSNTQTSSNFTETFLTICLDVIDQITGGTFGRVGSGEASGLAIPKTALPEEVLDVGVARGAASATGASIPRFDALLDHE